MIVVLIVLNCFKQSPTKTKFALAWAANQSLRIERDIMLRHPGVLKKQCSELLHVTNWCASDFKMTNILVYLAKNYINIVPLYPNILLLWECAYWQQLFIYFKWNCNLFKTDLQFFVTDDCVEIKKIKIQCP